MAKPSEIGKVGTEATNFAKASEWGICRCAGCRHYEAGRGTCAHPEVIADSEVKDRDSRNHPRVQPDDRCEYQRPPRPSIGTAARASGMRG